MGVPIRGPERAMRIYCLSTGSLKSMDQLVLQRNWYEAKRSGLSEAQSEDMLGQCQLLLPTRYRGIEGHTEGSWNKALTIEIEQSMDS